MDLSTWMGTLSHKINAKPLHAIVVPGSHNSGSYSVSAKKYGIGTFSDVNPKLGYFFERWAKCQHCDVYQQLVGGCRYIDLRVCVSHIDNQFRTEHTVLGCLVSECLEQLQKFLASTAKEIVILKIGGFRSGFSKVADHLKFVQHIKATILNWDAITVKFKERNLPFGKLAAQGRRIFCVYENDKTCRAEPCSLLPRSCLRSWWYNAATTEELFKAIKGRMKSFGQSRVTVMQAILTPDPRTTVMGFLIQAPRALTFFKLKCGGVPQNLGMLADVVNRKTLEFLKEHRDCKPTVVLIDGLGTGSGCAEEIVRFAINMN
jgi:hypothetical protein